MILGISLLVFCVIFSLCQQQQLQQRQQMESSYGTAAEGSSSSSSSLSTSTTLFKDVGNWISSAYQQGQNRGGVTFLFSGLFESISLSSSAATSSFAAVSKFQWSSTFDQNNGDGSLPSRSLRRRPASSSRRTGRQSSSSRRTLLNGRGNGFKPSYVDEHELRYLALGGGAFVANDVDVVYPELLSENVHTVSSRSNHINNDDDDDGDDNPTFASLCAQSMIGDDAIYDIITVQYPLSSSLSAVGLLLQRLRQRFPDATIVFVDVWSPLNAFYYDDSDAKVSFAQWRRAHINANTSRSSISLDDEVLADLLNHIWLLNEDEDRRIELEEMVEDAGGALYRLPRSTNDVGQTIVDWFVEGSARNGEAANVQEEGAWKYTLSAKAHSVIATDLEAAFRMNIEMTAAHIASSKSEVESQSSPPRLGTWGSGDSCQLWYETGKSTLPSQFSQGMSFVELTQSSPSSVKDRRQRGRRGLSSSSSSQTTGSLSRRYALEVTATSNDDSDVQNHSETLSSANLQVYNPFTEDRMVYLTYLTTSATASSKKVYPRTKVQLRQNVDDASSSSPCC
jgi:hypothetical protein